MKPRWDALRSNGASWRLNGSSLRRRQCAGLVSVVDCRWTSFILCLLFTCPGATRARPSRAGAFYSDTELTEATLGQASALFLPIGPKGTPKAANAAVAAELKATLNALYTSGAVGKRKAALVALLEVEGQAPRTLQAVSGAAERGSGFVPVVGTPTNPARFVATSTGNNGRVHDTEYKLLTYVANQLGAPSAKVRGTITLQSSQQACFSCTPVIGQFAQQFPNIRINYATGR